MCLVIILTDDAIKYTCTWPLAWRNKYKLYNSSTPLQWFLTFLFTSQEKGKQWSMKGLMITMVQWINLNWSNGSLLVCWYSILGKKLALSDEIWVEFEILKILYSLNYSSIYFVYYHCNVTTELELHFSQLLPSKAHLRCVLKCKIFSGLPFFVCQSLL